jgi:hypothetical protein
MTVNEFVSVFPFAFGASCLLLLAITVTLGHHR